MILSGLPKLFDLGRKPVVASGIWEIYGLGDTGECLDWCPWGAGGVCGGESRERRHVKKNSPGLNAPLGSRPSDS